MKIEKVDFKTYNEGMAKSLYNDAGLCFINEKTHDALNLFRRGSEYSQVVTEIEIGHRQNFDYLPALSYKSGTVRIGNLEEFVVNLRQVMNFDFLDLRRRADKLRFLIRFANFIISNRYKYSKYASLDDREISLIFNLSTLREEMLEPFLK